MALLPWRSSKSKFCCSGFHFAYEQIDERGFSIVPRHSPKFGPYFELTFHALDHEHRDTLLLNTPFMLSIAASQVIKFCPYCGADLRRFYANHTAITWRESSLGDPENGAGGAA